MRPLDCLSQGDESVVKSAQQQAVSRKAEYEAFVTEYRACREEFKERAETASSSSQGRQRGRAAKRARVEDAGNAFKSIPAEFSSLEQSFLKQYLPLGGYIWKNRHAGVWCTRYPPWSENRTRRSEEECVGLRRIIGIVWRQWCDAYGVEHSACPMQGITWTDLA